MNQRPFGYEPNELPGCSTPRYGVYYIVVWGSCQWLFFLGGEFFGGKFDHVVIVVGWVWGAGDFDGWDVVTNSE